jgi:hypothetical protein
MTKKLILILFAWICSSTGDQTFSIRSYGINKILKISLNSSIPTYYESTSKISEGYLKKMETDTSKITVDNSKLLIGKWRPYNHVYLKNGKMQYLFNGGGVYSISEFKMDGTYSDSYYQSDTLTMLITGNWKLSQSDTISYFNLTCETDPQIGPSMMTDKLIKVTDTLLIVTNGLFVSRNVWPKVNNPDKENGYRYYKRVQ